MCIVVDTRALLFVRTHTHITHAHAHANTDTHTHAHTYTHICSRKPTHTHTHTLTHAKNNNPPHTLFAIHTPHNIHIHKNHIQTYKRILTQMYTYSHSLHPHPPPTPSLFSTWRCSGGLWFLLLHDARGGVLRPHGVCRAAVEHGPPVGTLVEPPAVVRVRHVRHRVLGAPL